MTNIRKSYVHTTTTETVLGLTRIHPQDAPRHALPLQLDAADVERYEAARREWEAVQELIRDRVYDHADWWGLAEGVDLEPLVSGWRVAAGVAKAGLAGALDTIVAGIKPKKS